MVEVRVERVVVVMLMTVAVPSQLIYAAISRSVELDAPRLAAAGTN